MDLLLFFIKISTLANNLKDTPRQTVKSLDEIVKFKIKNSKILKN